MGKPPTRQCSRTVLINKIPDYELVEQNGKLVKVPLENDVDRKKFILKHLQKQAKAKGLENEYDVKKIFLIQDYS